MITEILTTAAYISGYTTIGTAVGWSVWKVFLPDKPFLDTPLSVFSGALWPVALPILAPFFLFEGVKRVRLSSLSRRLTAEQKVISYSETPMLVLAQIVAQRILVQPDNFKYGDQWKSEDGKIFLDLSYDCNTLNYLSVNGQKWYKDAFDKQSLDVIQKAAKESWKLKQERDSAKLKADRQLKALEAVESLLLKPEPKE